MSETATAASVHVTLADFERLEIRVGRVLAARPNPKARKPAYIIEADFGKLGTMTTSAQITAEYEPTQLVGTQIVGLLNLPSRKIAGVTSEFLLLAAVEDDGRTIIISPRSNVHSGASVR